MNKGARYSRVNLLPCNKKLNQMAQAIYNNNKTGAHFYSALFGSFTLYKAGSVLSPEGLPSAVKPAFGS